MMQPITGLPFDWAMAGVALEAPASGDVHVVAAHPRGALLAVIDGLGHGREAAAAARKAAKVLEQHAALPVGTLFERCHEALRSTRGAVMTVVSLDAPEKRITWAGVGNVEGLLLRADAKAKPAREAVALVGGVIGYQFPHLRPRDLSISEHDLLVMATDGIRSSFTSALALHHSPQKMADTILAGHKRGGDDALVLVARYLGAAP